MPVDYLSECMSGLSGVPFNEFAKMFCNRCVNNECSRSIADGMAFVKRVNTWEDRLFLNVPRADDNDPKYTNIRAKNFIKVDGYVPSVSNWSVTEPTEKIVEEAVKEYVNTEPKITEIKEQPVESVKQEEKPQIQQELGKSTSDNTPFQQGTILESDKSKEKNLKPGATYTFGDD